MSAALWYWRYQELIVEVFDSEEEAARVAAAIFDAGDGLIIGVQLEDGTTRTSDAWPALDAENRRLWQDYDAWADVAASVPQRKVSNPFGDGVATVPIDTPGWVGVRKEGT